MTTNTRYFAAALVGVALAITAGWPPMIPPATAS